MKRTILSILLLVLCSLALLSGCGKFGAATPEVKYLSLIPGECLNSGNLVFSYEGFKETAVYLHPRVLIFHFTLDMDVEKDVVSWIGGIVGHHAGVIRFKPTGKVYGSFGSESVQVEREYEALYTKYQNTVCATPDMTDLTTIYYSDALSLTADKDFAGIPAGEELSSLVLGPKEYGCGIKFSPPIAAPADYYALMRWFNFYIPIENGHEVEKETITFHFELPVKVGMLLNYLHDAQTNPEATMEFRDDVLTCDFTVWLGLH